MFTSYTLLKKNVNKIEILLIFYINSHFLYLTFNRFIMKNMNYGHFAYDSFLYLIFAVYAYFPVQQFKSLQWLSVTSEIHLTRNYYQKEKYLRTSVISCKKQMFIIAKIKKKQPQIKHWIPLLTITFS